MEMISKQNIGSRPCTCPLCRARIEGDKLNVNVTVSALIGRIQVRCTNVGCSWVGMHSEKETHMDTCPFMVIDCPNGPRGCLVKPERYALNLHIASCPFEKVPCFHCHIGVERSTLASHEDNCREIPRPCPLQCGEQLPRIALLKDEGVQKVVETPRPMLVDEGGVVSLENHDEHNILLATVKYTKETSTLKEMNMMLLPTHLGYHPEVGPEPTDVAILRSRPTCHTA
ncbi:RING finger protein 151-like [Pocillopora verrucosa]|uniref:RING finger protein 151-like n=1 Tax=Pocillopora verrucosa TaxID=203993 RepID=UPI003340427D